MEHNFAVSLQYHNHPRFSSFPPPQLLLPSHSSDCFLMLMFVCFCFFFGFVFIVIIVMHVAIVVFVEVAFCGGRSGIFLNPLLPGSFLGMCHCGFRVNFNGISNIIVVVVGFIIIIIIIIVIATIFIFFVINFRL